MGSNNVGDPPPASAEDLINNTKTCEGASDNVAFVLREKRHFCYEARPMPAPASEDHVIIAVCTTGICGSDVRLYSLTFSSNAFPLDHILIEWSPKIHYWTHGEIGDYKVEQPLTLGHESAGIVQQCGSDVHSLKPGDRVALEPGIPCQTCEYCRAGRYNLCPDVHFAATPPHDGTLSRYYTMPASFCYKLPAQITLEEGALLEPLSVAVHCVKLATITFGSSVLVLGAGPIGLLCCAVARAFGASNIVVVDIDEARLDFALAYAATASYRIEPISSEENATRMLSVPGMGPVPEFVIDATGAESCISMGIHAMKRGGTFVQAGLGAANVNFPVGQLCSKEGVYRGSFRYGPGDYKTAVELLQRKAVTVQELITHKYAFTEAEQAFANAEQRKGIKSIIYGPDFSPCSKL